MGVVSSQPPKGIPLHRNTSHDTQGSFRSVHPFLHHSSSYPTSKIVCLINFSTGQTLPLHHCHCHHFRFLFNCSSTQCYSKVQLVPQKDNIWGYFKQVFKVPDVHPVTQVIVIALNALCRLHLHYILSFSVGCCLVS